MLEKRMEWTVTQKERRTRRLLRFYASASLVDVACVAEDWLQIYGRHNPVGIRRRLVAHFREV